MQNEQQIEQCELEKIQVSLLKSQTISLVNPYH